MFLHACALVVVPGCLALAWWQGTRAVSGNTLSWAYTFEWPVFAGYALFMWWKLLHEQIDRRPAPEALLGGAPELEAAGAGFAVSEPGRAERPAGARTPDGEGPVEGEDEAELAAYNDYLAALSASGRRKRW
jgi:hypothetical protein